MTSLDRTRLTDTLAPRTPLREEFFVSAHACKSFGIDYYLPMPNPEQNTPVSRDILESINKRFTDAAELMLASEVSVELVTSGIKEVLTLKQSVDPNLKIILRRPVIDLEEIFTEYDILTLDVRVDYPVTVSVKGVPGKIITITKSFSVWEENEAAIAVEEIEHEGRLGSRKLGPGESSDLQNLIDNAEF